MQAFFYRHLVPAEQLLACVMEKPQPSKRRPDVLAGIEKLRPACAAGLAIPHGGSATLALPGLNALANNRPLTFVLSAPPPGLTMNAKSQGNATQFVFLSDPVKTKPGPLGNLIVNVFAEVQPRPIVGKPAKKLPPIQVATLPPIPCKIVPKPVGGAPPKLTTAP